MTALSVTFAITNLIHEEFFFLKQLLFSNLFDFAIILKTIELDL